MKSNHLPHFFSFTSQVKTEPASAPAKAPPGPAPSSGGDAMSVFSAVVAQGETVRQLKTSKAPKEQVDQAVKQLLALKAQFKELTGQEYKPGMAPPTPAPETKVTAVQPASPASDPASCPFTRVAEQGEVVRKLKAEKAPKVRPLRVRVARHFQGKTLRKGGFYRTIFMHFANRRVYSCK